MDPKNYFSFIKHMPYLIQTIGKAELYKWQNMKPESLKKIPAHHLRISLYLKMTNKLPEHLTKGNPN